MDMGSSTESEEPKVGLRVHIDRFSELSDRAKEKIGRYLGQFVPGEEVTIAPVPELPQGRLADPTEDFVAFARGGYPIAETESK